MKHYYCAIAISLFLPFAHAASPCARLYEEHLLTDLQLSYEDFDQNEHKGFRVLAKAGCNREAADLLERYVAHTKSSESSLIWHIAQMRAEQGAYPEAIRNARKVLKKTEDFEKQPLRWNDYVLAVIAFLERDKARLVVHREKIAAAASYTLTMNGQQFKARASGKLIPNGTVVTFYHHGLDPDGTPRFASVKGPRLFD